MNRVIISSHILCLNVFFYFDLSSLMQKMNVIFHIHDLEKIMIEMFNRNTSRDERQTTSKTQIFYCMSYARSEEVVRTIVKFD
jgi:hypothetical protein